MRKTIVVRPRSMCPLWARRSWLCLPTRRSSRIISPPSSIASAQRPTWPEYIRQIAKCRPRRVWATRTACCDVWKVMMAPVVRTPRFWVVVVKPAARAPAAAASSPAVCPRSSSISAELVRAAIWVHLGFEFDGYLQYLCQRLWNSRQAYTQI